MGERWHHLLTEVGRFMAVGGLATFVSILVFNFLVHGLYITSDPWLSGHPITAFVVASFVGMVISYRLSRSWTFRHRPPQAADGGRLAYFVINTATMIIPIACLWLSRNVLGLDDPYSDNLAGNIIGALLGQAARFYLFRTYVFQKPEGGYHLSDYLQLDNDDDVQVIAEDDQSTGQSTSGRVPPSAP